VTITFTQVFRLHHARAMRPTGNPTGVFLTKTAKSQS
jgi:hypothetical protein